MRPRLTPDCHSRLWIVSHKIRTGGIFPVFGPAENVPFIAISTDNRTIPDVQCQLFFRGNQNCGQGCRKLPLRTLALASYRGNLISEFINPVRDQVIVRQVALLLKMLAKSDLQKSADKPGAKMAEFSATGAVRNDCKQTIFANPRKGIGILKPVAIRNV
nr:hypothetical protein [Labrenzia sp. THAF35]